MTDASDPADWYYVGHYGQLGPLTMGQMNELAGDGVITADTYVWRNGMADWAAAGAVEDLRAALGVAQPEPVPPKAPTGPPPAPAQAFAPMVPLQPAAASTPAQTSWQYVQTHAPKSDKNRVLAGVLQLVLPGVGRLYLGYAAHGIMQIFLWGCGVGWLWGFIDGIYILAGGVKLDGYGQRLED